MILTIDRDVLHSHVDLGCYEPQIDCMNIEIPVIGASRVWDTEVESDPQYIECCASLIRPPTILVVITCG